MPLLAVEPCIQPENLLDTQADVAQLGMWWALHTRPRAEKTLARRFVDRGARFYLPLHQRTWLKRGRRFSSYLPLFPGYLFMHGDLEDRRSALETNLVAHVIPVEDQEQLRRDLVQLHSLLTSGAPVTPEDRLEPGDPVEVIKGPLTGLEGKVIRRGKNLKFVIEVQLLRRAVSAEVESWMLQPLGA